MTAAAVSQETEAIGCTKRRPPRYGTSCSAGTGRSTSINAVCLLSYAHARQLPVSQLSLVADIVPQSLMKLRHRLRGYGLATVGPRNRDEQFFDNSSGPARESATTLSARIKASSRLCVTWERRGLLLVVDFKKIIHQQLSGLRVPAPTTAHPSAVQRDQRQVPWRFQPVAACRLKAASEAPS